MDRCFIIKLVISFLLVLSYFLLPKYGFTSFNYNLSTLTNNLLYPISHANIFHLAGNILCLWMLRCPLHIVATYLIAVICSFLPCPTLSSLLFPLSSLLSLPLSSEPEATYGFSGVLFAIVGISWGRARRFRDMLWRNKWILIIPSFIPHINFLIHLYCLLAGYAYGRLIIAAKPSGVRQSHGRKTFVLRNS